MKLLSTVATAAALTLVGFGASAATYDFGQLAVQAGEKAWDDVADGSYAGGTFDDASDTYTVGGIGVTADGYVYKAVNWGMDGDYTTFNVKYDESSAYLDGISNNLEAGLGVCTDADNDGGSPCQPSNDDNTGPAGGLANSDGSIYEFVTLTFDAAVTFTDFLFRDDGHNILSSGLIGVSLDAIGADMTFYVVDIMDLLGIIADENAFSMTWSFAALSPASCDRANGLYDLAAEKVIGEPQPIEYTSCSNFYIDGATVAAVPLPAAGWLLIAGLGGLAAMRRRKS